MSSRNNEDWDLCWQHFSSNGCKNKNCTWRHEKTAGQPFLNYRRNRGIRISGDSRRKAGLPFYSTKQHQYDVIENQYSSVFYPEDRNRYGGTVESRLLRKNGHLRGIKNDHPALSPISVSTPEITSALVSIANSGMSRGGSDSEGWTVKNAEAFPGENVENQKLKSSIRLEEVDGKYKTPKTLRSFAYEKSASVLSPFAKVFVPGETLRTPTTEREELLEENEDGNCLSAKIEQPVDFKLGDAIIDKVNKLSIQLTT